MVSQTILGVKEIIAERFCKYTFVGFLGFILNVNLLYLITEYFNLYYLFSAVFSFLSANLVTFSLDKTWAFDESIENKFFQKYKVYFLFSISVLLMQLFILWSLTNFFGVYYIHAQIIAVLSLGILGFLFNAHYTFKQRMKK